MIGEDGRRRRGPKKGQKPKLAKIIDSVNFKNQAPTHFIMANGSTDYYLVIGKTIYHLDGYSWKQGVRIPQAKAPQGLKSMGS